ncbi:tRNA preQ1(34) S-adenosylmethionine ribosyltransferase-isomerase QueA [Candidatus Poribacteria bacterium]|nr:tRNA preQ1(34) S-adenosylmethionine ribosyltransferase-isomerase QueA [Candidatus Poribacteria bacterium]
MKLSLFDYDLPEELIAQYPLPKREESGLMVLDRKSRSITHSQFRFIGEFLSPNDLLVLNDTKVIPARLVGKKCETGAKIELFLVAEKERDIWEALIKPGKRVKNGTVVEFGEGILKAQVSAKLEAGTYIVRLKYQGRLQEILSQIGQTPLPPYIKRQPEPIDKIRYQNVYAAKNGAVAAPTAGLHFTQELLDSLQQKGIGVTNLTLHVGLGTFQPVKAEEVEAHKMHAEYFEISPEAVEQINLCKQKGGRIVAVGTTSVRTLETVADNNRVVPQIGFTDLFIYPGYQFKIVDALITNFHLPKSTLLMLVSTFASREFVLEAYQEAIKQRYRFYSYGDAMLIL